MNEKIKELAVKSGAKVVQESQWGTDFDTKDFDLEKFSELLVEKCVNIVESCGGVHSEQDRDEATNLIISLRINSAKSNIKSYFGC